MSQEALQPARVRTFRRQGIAGGVPQHMHMNWERQVCDLAAALNYTGDAHTAERLTALETIASHR